MSNDRLQFEYRITFTTPFHFGTGLREGLIDRSVRRDAHGYLYVPGSTLKGVMRERCEQLARLIEPNNIRIASPHDADNALKDLYDPTAKTIITHIFGSHNHPGLLFFDDAHQSDEDLMRYDDQKDTDKYKRIQTEIYTQVRLERITRTAVPGALYTSEFGLRELSFVGKISGWLNHTPIAEQPVLSHELLLMLAGFLMVDRLGGNKSSGKGACTNEIINMQINGKAIPQDTWASWLDYLDQLTVSKGEVQ